MTKTIAILGSTGSVGRQTVECAIHLGYKVNALTCHGNTKLLEEQARLFNPKYVWIGEDNYVNLKNALKDTFVTVLTGKDELCRVARDVECDLVCNSLLGFSGLEPTLAAIDGKHDIALSNKEALVAGGSLVMAKAKEKNIKIIPVDSEHSAIFQCMNGKKPKRIYLTASGGPFFGKTKEFLEKVTLKDALVNPNWSMGQKITVDSSTMMNKGLEIIEAVWLFGVSPDDIEVLVHRESVIHSMVGFDDNTVIAQLAKPDMRLCVQYALTYPERMTSLTGEIDFPSLARLTFAAPDYENFPLLSLAVESIKKGGNIPAALSAANEAAVDCFLKEKLSFTGIFDAVKKVTQCTEYIKNPSLSDIMLTDSTARNAVYALI